MNNRNRNLFNIQKRYNSIIIVIFVGLMMVNNRCANAGEIEILNGEWGQAENIDKKRVVICFRARSFFAPDSYRATFIIDRATGVGDVCRVFWSQAEIFVVILGLTPKLDDPKVRPQS